MADLSIIKIILKEKGLTIRELANSVNISEQGLHKLIKENSTKVDTLENICKALDVPISIFFKESAVDKSTKQNELLESQQRTIENLSEVIKNLTNKC